MTKNNEGRRIVGRETALGRVVTAGLGGDI